jgi:hypothetical protein
MSKSKQGMAQDDDTIGSPVADFSKLKEHERRSHSARCGHVKRRLLEGRPLTGELLDFALSIIGDQKKLGSLRLSDLGRKLIDGERLTEYQLHLMVDVYLLHAKLGSQREGMGHIA